MTTTGHQGNTWEHLSNSAVLEKARGWRASGRCVLGPSGYALEPATAGVCAYPRERPQFVSAGDLFDSLVLKNQRRAECDFHCPRGVWRTLKLSLFQNRLVATVSEGYRKCQARVGGGRESRPWEQCSLVVTKTSMLHAPRCTRTLRGGVRTHKGILGDWRPTPFRWIERTWRTATGITIF